MARERDGGSHPLQVGAHEGDGGGFEGHVGARAHGQAHVGAGQGRRVVDAIAHHGHGAALGLQGLHVAGLVGGQHLGYVARDAHLRGHGGGGLGVVAGHHDDLQALCLQLLNGAQRGWAQCVGYAEHGGGLTIEGHVEHRFGLSQ